MNAFCDPRMKAEHPTWGDFEPKAAAQAFGDLTAYLGKPLQAIAKEFWCLHDGVDAQAQAKAAQARDETTVMEYYQQTPVYLYELSYWEACHDKQGWFRVLAKASRTFGLTQLLDYGGGVGGVSLFLHARGISCDYVDIAGPTFDYAAWRFARQGLQVQMFNILEGWPSAGRYDAVVAWDVLEHVFDLEGTIANIGKLLKPGGWLLDKSTFGDTHDTTHVHLAKHAPYQDVARLNAMVSRYGFRYGGQLKPDGLSRLLRSVGMRTAVSGVKISPRVKHGGNFLIHERVKDFAEGKSGGVPRGTD